MTNKEAVEIAKNVFQTELNREYSEKRLSHVIEGLKEAEKDLEVLEIIKKNKDVIFSKKPNYDNVSPDDFFTIKGRLDNEKDR